jgi:hypothetical protein
MFKNARYPPNTMETLVLLRRTDIQITNVIRASSKIMRKTKKISQHKRYFQNYSMKC